MLIAQITDLHVTRAGAFPRTFVDGVETLERVVAELNAMPVQPDVVLATGDLVNDGTPEEYGLLAECVDQLRAPLVVLPGNHDDPAVMADAFAGAPALPAEPPLHFVVGEHEVRIVGLDVVRVGLVGGVFDREAAAWLDRVLAAGADHPTLLALHHPPFATGIVWMDRYGLEGADLLAEVLARHPQVGRVVAGHIHRPITATLGAAIASTCPSTAHQVALDLDPGGSPALVDEPPGYQLHRFTDSGWLTHTASVPAARRADFLT